FIHDRADEEQLRLLGEFARDVLMRIVPRSRQSAFAPQRDDRRLVRGLERPDPHAPTEGSPASAIASSFSSYCWSVSLPEKSSEYLPRVRLGHAAGSIAITLTFFPPRSCAPMNGNAIPAKFDPPPVQPTMMSG